MMKQMIKITGLAVAIGLTSLVQAVEKGPLLISDVPPTQVYTEQQLANYEHTGERERKGSNATGLEKDYKLYQDILGIDPENITEKQHELLLQSSQHQPQAYRSHSEGPVAIPAYDIKALANSKLLEYKVATQVAKMQQLLHSNTEEFVQQSAMGRIQFLAAKKVLIESQPLSDSIIRQLVDRYQSSDKSFSRAMLYELVTLTGDETAVLAVLNKSDIYWHKHDLLTNLHQYIPVQKQEKILRDIILQKNQLSSQGLLEYAKLPQSVLEPELFYDLLSDSKLGSTSATALAQYYVGTPDFQKLIATVKNNQGSRTLVANSLLALKLSNNPDAMSAIQDIVDGGYIPFDDIRAEVASWLN